MTGSPAAAIATAGSAPGPKYLLRPASAKDWRPTTPTPVDLGTARVCEQAYGETKTHALAMLEKMAKAVRRVDELDAEGYGEAALGMLYAAHDHLETALTEYFVAIVNVLPKQPDPEPQGVYWNAPPPPDPDTGEYSVPCAGGCGGRVNAVTSGATGVRFADHYCRRCSIDRGF